MNPLGWLIKVLTKLNNVNRKAPSYRRVKWGIIIGSLLTYLSGVVIIGLPIAINIGLNCVRFEEDGYLTWAAQLVNIKDLPIKVPVYAKIYLWALENPDEFAEGAKPLLRQVGPFAFGVTSGQLEIESFDRDGETMFLYANDLGVKLEESRSDMDAYDQKITILNPISFLPAMAVQNVLDHIPLSFVAKPLVYLNLNAWFLYHGEGLIKEITPRQLVEGMEVSMLDTLEALVIKPIRWLGLDRLPFVARGLELFYMHIKDNKFGVLPFLNGARVGPIEVTTGKLGFKSLGRLVSVYGFNLDMANMISMVQEPRCRKRNGTTIPWGGTNMDKDEIIYINIPCRPLAFSYKSWTFPMGAPQYRYWLSPEFFAGPKRNPYNGCFCPYPEEPELCDGVVHFGLCYFYAPVSISLPHFLYGGKELLSLVDGMSPDPDKHETYMDFNPTLGFPMDGKVRVQVNLDTRPISMMYGFGSIPVSVYPILWVDVPDMSEWVEVLHHLGLLGWALFDYGMWALFWLGLTILLLSIRRAYKDRHILFPGRGIDVSSMLDRMSSPDRKVMLKASQVYPNLFTLSNDLGLSKSLGPKYPMYFNNCPEMTLKGRKNSLPMVYD